MKYPKIDEAKLEEVKKLIDKAAGLMEEKDCSTDKEAQHELNDLQNKLRTITGKKKIKISNYQAYWSYTDLETVAKMALHSPPEKSNLTDEQITELIIKISNVEFDEAAIDYFLQVLEIETGLDNITDYIFNPDVLGMELDAGIEEIIKRILADKR